MIPLGPIGRQLGWEVLEAALDAALCLGEMSWADAANEVPCPDDEGEPAIPAWPVQRTLMGLRLACPVSPCALPPKDLVQERLQTPGLSQFRQPKGLPVPVGEGHRQRGAACPVVWFQSHHEEGPT